jgi:hypothetical protein
MNYSFACPVPCNREIIVNASGNLDAVEKIIMAGGMSCRNTNYDCSCQHNFIDMSPVPEDELRRIVSFCLQEE